jgi:hypothetical protein
MYRHISPCIGLPTCLIFGVNGARLQEFWLTRPYTETMSRQEIIVRGTCSVGYYITSYRLLNIYSFERGERNFCDLLWVKCLFNDAKQFERKWNEVEGVWKEEVVVILDVLCRNFFLQWQSEKPATKLGQVICYLGRDLNQGCPGYEALYFGVRLL